jgi:hypothetical protein
MEHFMQTIVNQRARVFLTSPFTQAYAPSVMEITASAASYNK